MNEISERILCHKMKRLAASHPFFLRPNGLLSRREAKRLLHSNTIPNGHEVIQQTRLELGIIAPPPLEKWKPRKPVSSLWCKVAIGLFVLLLMVSFFTMTEAGMAFAESIYHIIVRVVDDSFSAQGESIADDIDAIDFSTLPSKFESLEAVAEATGRQIVIPDGEDILTSFTVHILDENTVVIRSKYSSESGGQYTVSQTLYNDAASWGSSNNTIGEITTVGSGIGATAYLSTMVDGTVYAEIYGADYNISIRSAAIDLNDLQDIVKGLTYLENGK